MYDSIGSYSTNTHSKLIQLSNVKFVRALPLGFWLNFTFVTKQPNNKHNSRNGPKK